MKTLIYWFLSQVFERMLSLKERIAVFSWKLGDKTYEEVSTLPSKYGKQPLIRANIRLPVNMVSFKLLDECCSWYRQMLIVFQDVFHPLPNWYVWICSQVAWYCPLIVAVFIIFDSTFDALLYMFHYPVSRKRWVLFLLRITFLQTYVREINRLMFS